MAGSNVNAAIRGAILALGLAASACDRLPDPQFAQIGDSLKLKIAKISRSKSGASAEFVFIATNVGSHAVTACLGGVRSVAYDTSGPVGGISLMMNSHPACSREFTIEPGRDMTWSEVFNG